MDRAVKAIMKKDIYQVWHNKQVLMPMLVVPIVFSVFLPLTTMGSAMADMAEASSANVQEILNVLGGIKSFILLIPLMVASIMASNAIVGEKERKTLETLLYSPVTTSRIFFAKCMAAFFVSMIVTVVSCVLFSTIVNSQSMKYLDTALFTGMDWLLIVVLMAPAITLLGIFFMVLVSAKVKSFQASQQWSLIIMLPLLAFVMVQSTGLVTNSVLLFVVVGVGMLILDFVLIIKGLGKFTRPKLMDASLKAKDIKKMSLQREGIGNRKL